VTIKSTTDNYVMCELNGADECGIWQWMSKRFEGCKVEIEFDTVFKGYQPAPTIWIRGTPKQGDRNGGPATNKANGGSEAEAQICPYCSGDPVIEYYDNKWKCFYCNGTGKLHHSQHGWCQSVLTMKGGAK